MNYQQHRGVFVRQLDRRDIRDIFKARQHLEVLALTINTPVSEFHLNRMQQHLVNATLAAGTEQWRDVGTHSLRFHQSIVQMLACQRFNDFFSILLAQLRLLFCSGAGEREFQRPWIARDQEILSLLTQQQPQAACSALIDYLNDSEHQLATSFSHPV